MTEVDYSAGEQNAPRDNAEQEAAATAGGHTGEVDLNADASGTLADLVSLKSEMDAAYGVFMDKVVGVVSKASEAFEEATSKAASVVGQTSVTSSEASVPVNPTLAPADSATSGGESGTVTLAPSTVPPAPTTEPPASDATN